MTIERCMVCDNCGGIIAGEDTVRRLRKTAYSDCKAKHIGDSDYCRDCLSRGYPKSNST